MEQTIEYNNHTITLSDEWRFRIDGPLVTEKVHQWAESAAEAREKIDTLVKQDAATHRVRLSIPVLVAGGVDKTVTGIHGGHLKALGLGDADYMWPVHPHLRALLREKNAINDRLREVNKVLGRYQIRAMPDAYERSHDAAVAGLQRRIAEATAKANAELTDSEAAA